MIPLEKPALSIDKIFQDCVNSIRDKIIRERVAKADKYIRGSHKVYGICAGYQLLHLLPEESLSNSVCSNYVSAPELIDIYEKQFVNNKEPKLHYNQIKNLAPRGICPYCMIGQVTTLDHLMPKASFQSYTVSPYNLVPSCLICNKDKGGYIPKVKNEQILHPYFDAELNREQWLFARIAGKEKKSINYFVNAPSSWSQDGKSKVLKHFEVFKLSHKFSVEAGVELDALRFLYESKSYSYIQSDLKERAEGVYKLHKNYWKTAMYQALLKSEWYCRGGYLSI